MTKPQAEKGRLTPTRREGSGDHLKGSRGDVAVLARPQLFDEFGVDSGDLPLHSQRVVLVQLVCVLVFEEVVRQRRSVA